eukprot:CAMPEP_0170408998 /NCGR_PEP_ID=MMETSP0117_2-20130122/29098_1 /TAXON_ID=400756 /ORGANISM="Durinskia baltica, Strain CSIRO CS-38" /LENGTH=33 /DNA_ID= /DNA_START= /DNA_END= /DNA_ORIENTATION=
MSLQGAKEAWRMPCFVWSGSRPAGVPTERFAKK